jgi:hypothetical protein
MHRTGLTLNVPQAQQLPDQINFFVRASATNAAGGFVHIASGSRVRLPGITFYMGATGRMGFNLPLRGFVGIPYVANQWYRVSVKFTWSAEPTLRRFDFLINDSLIATNLPFAVNDFSKAEEIHIYNFDNTQAWFDEIELVQGGRLQSVVISPRTATGFSQGAWTGAMTVFAPATNMWLIADDGASHVGTSGLFTVLPATDSDNDGLPDAWEISFFGSIGAPQAAPDADADGDGATNLQEFQAGTRPNDASSTLRVIAVRLSGNNVEVDFASAAGKTYRLERSEAVQGGMWNPVSGAVLGTGEVLRITDSVGVGLPARFYRVSLSQ